MDYLPLQVASPVEDETLVIVIQTCDIQAQTWAVLARSMWQLYASLPMKGCAEVVAQAILKLLLSVYLMLQVTCLSQTD